MSKEFFNLFFISMLRTQLAVLRVLNLMRYGVQILFPTRYALYLSLDV